jgi:hypothetical protein
MKLEGKTDNLLIMDCVVAFAFFDDSFDILTSLDTHSTITFKPPLQCFDSILSVSQRSENK